MFVVLSEARGYTKADGSDDKWSKIFAIDFLMIKCTFRRSQDWTGILARLAKVPECGTFPGEVSFQYMSRISVHRYVVQKAGGCEFEFLA